MEHSVLQQALQSLEVLDGRIVRLLSLRRQLASQLAKASPGQEIIPSLDERVVAVISRLAPSNQGPLDGQRLASLFETVIQLTEPRCNRLAARNNAPKKG